MSEPAKWTNGIWESEEDYCKYVYQTLLARQGAVIGTNRPQPLLPYCISDAEKWQELSDAIHTVLAQQEPPDLYRMPVHKATHEAMAISLVSNPSHW